MSIIINQPQTNTKAWNAYQEAKMAYEQVKSQAMAQPSPTKTTESIPSDKTEKPNRPQEKEKVKDTRKKTVTGKQRFGINKQDQQNSIMWLQDERHVNSPAVRILAQAFGKDASTLHQKDLEDMSKLLEMAKEELDTDDVKKLIPYIRKSADKAKHLGQSEGGIWRALLAKWRIERM